MNQILLAGKNHAILALLQQILRTLGYSYQTLRSPADIHSLDPAQFKAVIVDDDADLEEQIKAGSPKVPVIRLCTSTQRSHAKGLVVSKPFRIEDISNALGHAEHPHGQ